MNRRRPAWMILCIVFAAWAIHPGAAAAQEAASAAAAAIPEKALTCGDTWCTGTFAELFTSIEIVEWGPVFLHPKSAVRDALAASTANCSGSDKLWLRHSNGQEQREISDIERAMTSSLIVAKHTGDVIKVVWGSSVKVPGNCDIQKIRLLS